METIYKEARYQIIPQYVSDLRSKIGYYLGWIPNEFADQVTADNAYDLLKNDISIGHALHLHSCMAGGEKFKIIAEAPFKYILEKMLKRMPDLMHARKSLIENGMLFGLGVQRKNYEKFRMREYPGIEWIGISSIEEVDCRRLRLERPESAAGIDDKTQLYWTIWNPQIDKYIIIEDRSDNPHAPDGSGIQDYVWYFHEREEMSPYFRGIGQVLYAMAHVRKFCLMYWGDLCESWSKPFLTMFTSVTKGTLNALLGGDIRTATEKAELLLSMMEGIRSRHCAVLDEGDKFEIKEHGTTGNNIIQDLLKYCDEKIQLFLLGAELTTGTGEGVGSYALGNIHRQQTETLIMYSRGRLQEVLLRDIIYDLLYRNRMNLYRLGCYAPEPGDVELELYIEMEKKKEAALEQYLTRYRGNMDKII